MLNDTTLKIAASAANKQQPYYKYFDNFDYPNLAESKILKWIEP